MKELEAWKLFEATGNPHAYMIYRREKDKNSANRGKASAADASQRN